ncbi:MAG: polyprenol monophosphomannose synthase [Pirellulales bacterium]
MSETLSYTTTSGPTMAFGPPATPPSSSQQDMPQTAEVRTTGRVLVTLATYNEIENVPLMVDAILGELPTAEVLVIDDNSPDGTGQWCEDRRQTEPRLKCLHRTGKQGLGTAIIAGLKYAIDHGYDYVINMDADMSHPPRNLPELLAGMHGDAAVDCMIGSRYVAGGGVEGWPAKRYLMSKSVNFYARTMLGLSPGDVSGSYRCYRVETLKKLDLDAVRSRGYAFQEEILWHVKRAGGRFGETPITFVDRQRGQSKIRTSDAVEALWVIFVLGIKNWITG